LRSWLAIKNAFPGPSTATSETYRYAWRVPGYRAPVVRNAGGEREMVLMRWAWGHAATAARRRRARDGDGTPIELAKLDP